MIERAGAVDLMMRACDVGPAPLQVGAIMRLAAPAAGEASPTIEPVRDAVRERTAGLPRLRQMLVATPLGCGRPVWVDDPGFDVANHVRQIPCPPPGDEQALLEVAAGVLTARLPAEHPLWSVSLVSGLADGGSALVVAFHHVLADGMGGLAVLASLADGAGPPPAACGARPAPQRRALARDAAGSRLAAPRRLGALPGHLRAAACELRPDGALRAPRCSLNRPTGPRRSYAVVRAELARLLATAREHGATLNDVLLVAVGGALHALLDARAEHTDHFLIAVPVSGREQASAARLGNELGVMPVVVPGRGAAGDQLRDLASSTARRRTERRGASSAVLAPGMRALGALGVLGLAFDRQRRANTVVTNLRGPQAPGTFLGLPVRDLLALNFTTGNVTVTFAALSYAGTLAVTITADPDAVPDLAVLAGALQDLLHALAGLETPA